jgi:hypothetical protein
VAGGAGQNTVRWHTTCMGTGSHQLAEKNNINIKARKR